MEPKFNCPVTLHKDGTYTVSIAIDFGNMTPADFIAVATLANTYHVSKLAVTTAKRISFLNTPAEQVNPLWDAIQQTFGERLHLANGKIVVCPGQSVCRFANKDYDNLSIAKEIAKITQHYSMTNLKIGISNCPRSCAMAHMRDIGVIAAVDGWNITIGGNGGLRPGTGYTLATGLSDEKLLHLIDRFLAYIQENRTKQERTIRTIERIGIESVKAALLAE